MVDDDTDTFTGHPPVHNQKAARQVYRVALIGLGQDQSGSRYFILLWVVKQGAVDTPLVRSFVMDELVLGKGRLLQQVGQHPVVLHFGHTDKGRSLGHFVARQGRKHPCHIRQLGFILLRCPLVAAPWQEIIIVLAGIVNGIKQILKIVERHAIQAALSVLRPHADGKEAESH